MMKQAVVLLLFIFLFPTLTASAYSASITNITLHPGENWIAPSLSPLSPAPTSIFNSISIDNNLVRFDAATQQSITYAATNPAAFGDILMCGGYKIHNTSAAPIVITYTGIALSDNIWFSLCGNLTDGQNSGGMHWVGNPFNYNISIDSMMVLNTATSSLLPLHSAINSGWIDPIWYGFDGPTQRRFSTGHSAFSPEENYFRTGHMYEVASRVDNLVLIIKPDPVPEPSGLLVLTGGLGSLISLGYFRKIK